MVASPLCPFVKFPRISRSKLSRGARRVGRLPPIEGLSGALRERKKVTQYFQLRTRKAGVAKHHVHVTVDVTLPSLPTCGSVWTTRRHVGRLCPSSENRRGRQALEPRRPLSTDMLERVPRENIKKEAGKSDSTRPRLEAASERKQQAVSLAGDYPSRGVTLSRKSRKPPATRERESKSRGHSGPPPSNPLRRRAPSDAIESGPTASRCEPDPAPTLRRQRRPEPRASSLGAA